MSIESAQELPKKESDIQNEYEHIVSDITHDIEGSLEQQGFTLAEQTFVSHVLQRNELYCRSESMTRILSFLETEEPLQIFNKNGAANMCSMASGDGFRVAMEEGISKIERDKFAKVVLSFKGEHLSSRENVSPDDSLWETKPNTARVSLSGEGSINLEDIEMISVRYPTRYFPAEEYMDSELERIEEAGIEFIVRHYIPTQRKTTH